MEDVAVTVVVFSCLHAWPYTLWCTTGRGPKTPVWDLGLAPFAFRQVALRRAHEAQAVQRCFKLTTRKLKRGDHKSNCTAHDTTDISFTDEEGPWPPDAFQRCPPCQSQ